MSACFRWFLIFQFLFKGIKKQVKACEFFFFCFLPCRWCVFAKNGIRGTPLFFPWLSKCFLNSARGGFLARKLRDPAACRLVLIAGKSHPKTGVVVSTIWALGWARIFCHIFANPCFLVLDYRSIILLPVTRTRTFSNFSSKILNLDRATADPSANAENSKYYWIILPD